MQELLMHTLINICITSGCLFVVCLNESCNYFKVVGFVNEVDHCAPIRNLLDVINQVQESSWLNIGFHKHNVGYQLQLDRS